ncbi:unnamed protein product [Nezara viridula]|uniref:Pescadillo homolog n=1 Tax=Nezara viridula TaxID=85310 RepID=A0A9P0GXN0_NEZVI|nr:unnamed protein product [Nezara viridula]
MAGPRKKKYTSGEGNQYWTRATALRKLQLSLKDFRRLCILKGIYPREPKNRKKAQKGATGIKTLYNKKDIQFLMHEPIIWKFREMKVQGRKIGRAKAMNENGLARRLMNKHVIINLDHIVKERYPTYLDALRDLDDCLTLCTLFSTFPSIKHIPRDQSSLCRRLVLEFMQAIITSRALRKVFISIKGYYFQAEIKGVTITWIMPHQFSFEPQTREEVDFRIMSTFVQFYIVLLGFVNFRFYNSLNLYYPPRISIASDESDDLIDKAGLESERIAALNIPLSCTSTDVNTEEEQDPVESFNMAMDENDKMEKAYLEAEKIRKLKKLFEGLKFFLNREVPREPLVFILRSFGALVSWDKTLFVGSTFDETDETITHQIVDRPSLSKQYVSRYYVQPQWIFDSVNARELLPVEKYFIGAVLPPHLSPFVEERDQYYSPPEAVGLDTTGEVINGKSQEDGKDNESVGSLSDNNSEEEDEKNDDERDQMSNSSSEDEKETSNNKGSPINSNKDIKKKAKAMKKKMAVAPGKLEKPDPNQVFEAEKQERKLRERMVEKKHRALYKSMMRGRAERIRDKNVLKKKRLLIEKTKSGIKATS